jgi:hypothetical protein
MRLSISITIMLILIIIASIGGYYIIVVLANNVGKELEILQDYIDKEKWKEARKSSMDLLKKWNKSQYFMTILVNHSELDELEVRLAKISSMINIKANKKEILPEIAIARKLIENIPEQEKLSIKNIF